MERKKGIVLVTKHDEKFGKKGVGLCLAYWI
jgi:hypothetical protein